jgi:hypothetical protein
VNTEEELLRLLAYTKLKADLKAEYKRTSSSDAKLTDAEHRSYKHVVHEASTKLRAATNSRSEHWHSGLYEAHSDFQHEISGLKKR